MRFVHSYAAHVGLAIARAGVVPASTRVTILVPEAGVEGHPFKEDIVMHGAGPDLFQRVAAAQRGEQVQGESWD